MDDPLGALDRKLREQMQIEIKRIHRSVGTTVIYVTHDQNEALTMSDLVVVMHEARVAQIGTPRVLYEAPANVFVADFLATPTCSPPRSSAFQPTTHLLRLRAARHCARSAAKSQPRSAIGF